MATGKFPNDGLVRQVRGGAAPLAPRLVLEQIRDISDCSLAGRRRCSAPERDWVQTWTRKQRGRGDRAHRVDPAAAADRRGQAQGLGAHGSASLPGSPERGGLRHRPGGRGLFREHRGAVPSYVASLGEFSEAALRASVPEGPIFIHGGGNFGDLWPRHQEFREHLLERFTEREIIQLPQSIHFADRGRVARTARAIAGHGKFRLLVRDLASYEFAAANFDCESDSAQTWPSSSARWSGRGRPKWTCCISCAPTRSARSLSRPGGRTHLPSGRLDEGEPAFIPGHRLLGIVRPSPWAASPGELRSGWYDAVARARLARGCRLLSSGRVVITDRLHGHILSLSCHPARRPGQQLRQAAPVS